MTTYLIIEASPRGAQSVSSALAQRYVEALPADATIVRRRLADTPLRFTDLPWLAAYFTSPGEQTDAMRAALALSDTLVAELLQADVIVLATPVYNYNVPAALKAWFDHIVRKGITLGVDGAGLLAGRRCTVLLASGGVYTEGSPIRARDLATAWLRLMLNVLGIADVTFVAAGGTKVIDLGQQARADYLAAIAPEVLAAVQADAG